LLQKISGGVPHGGGIRMGRDTPEYAILRGWIAADTPLGAATAPRGKKIRGEPSERQLAMNAPQQLRLISQSSDGREVDVTGFAKFQTNNEGLAAVSAGGLVTAGEAAGEAAVMASFMGAVDVFRVLIPRPERIAHYPRLPENNFIDKLVFQKLQKLNIVPFKGCAD